MRRLIGLLAAVLVALPWAYGSTRAEVVVEGATRETLDMLVEQGYDVDAWLDGRIRLYVSEEGLASLRAAGYAVTVLGYDPDPPVFSAGAKGLGIYNDYASVSAMVEGFAAAYPDICRRYTLGQSVEGRELWGLLISDNPDMEEDEPEFKYVSTMHGNEPVGTEMCLYLIDLLVTNYGAATAEGARLTALVDETVIWIVPLMNPDGLEAGSRYNSDGDNLNRAFPSYVQEGADGTVFDGDPLDAAGRPVEVQRVMAWSAQESFVLSANIHTGSLVVNYPFDEGDAPPHTYTVSPDDALFIEISKRYSVHNPPMWGSASFPFGISNGGAWYTIYGGMQDWNYRYLSCNEVTLELSDVKKPSEALIPGLWDENRESMLAYMESVHMGVRGIVSDADSGAPLYAEVLVAGNAQPVYSDPDVGDYHRMLLPGTYTLSVSAPGYETLVIEDVLVADGAATRRDAALPRILVDPDYAVRIDGGPTVWKVAGGSHSFEAVVEEAKAAMTFAWYHDGDLVQAGPSPTLNLAMLAGEDGGVYRCHALSDGVLPALSNGVVLTVADQLPVARAGGVVLLLLVLAVGQMRRDAPRRGA